MDFLSSSAGRPPECLNEFGRGAAPHPAPSCHFQRGRLRIHPRASVPRGVFPENHGRGARGLINIGLIAGVTFREAARRKILWTALLAAAAFLALFATGMHYQAKDLRATT